MAYSKGLRGKEMEHLAAGHTQEPAKAIFKVGLTTIKRWKKQYNETGDVSNKVPNRSFKKINPEKVTACLEKHPDSSQLDSNLGNRAAEKAPCIASAMQELVEQTFYEK